LRIGFLLGESTARSLQRERLSKTGSDIAQIGFFVVMIAAVLFAAR
jgi:hypothetical protein